VIGVRAPLAALSGILLGLAFPRFGASWLAPLALAPLLAALQLPGAPAVSVRRAFRLGYLTGAVFFLILLYWIPKLPRENVTIPFFMYPMLGVMVAYLSLFPAFTAMVSVFLARRGAPLGLVFPAVWTLFEALRSTGTFGFAWGALGYALAPVPQAIQFASLTGIWGVTLWAALVAGTVHTALVVLRKRSRAAVLVTLTALLVLPLVHGAHVVARREPRPSVAVGLIQPNVGNNKWQLAVRDSVIDALFAQTAAFAQTVRATPPTLLVWPETAVPARLRRDPVWTWRAERLVDSLGVPVLAGFPDGERLADGRIRYTNAAGLLVPQQGMVAQYDKRQLVPFSEYFPLPLLDRVDFGQSSFSAGTTPGLMTVGGVPFGVLICYESIFPKPCRELAREGARYLVNITNDQWFGDSAAPAQHFEMNVLRCIENRMGMARAANTGISGAIDPYGIVLARTPTFVTDARIVPVELRGETTLYTRWGDWILVPCALAVLGFAVPGLRRRA
jgi:apolipoprotein N-acyltransferase